MNEEAAKKPKPVKRYVYMVWRTMKDPRDGSAVRALVAASAVDLNILKARRFRPDGRVRVEIKNPRHEGFHRLVHVFGEFLIQHVPGYEKHGKDAHAAVKDCQVRSGAACELQKVDMDIPGIGMCECGLTVPRSLSFDEMDEDEFKSAFDIMVNYTAENDYPGLRPEQIADFESLMEQT